LAVGKEALASARGETLTEPEEISPSLSLLLRRRQRPKLWDGTA